MQVRAMTTAESRPSCAGFYQHAMELLREQNVPFLIGGAYAVQWYTGIAYRTKDLDMMVRASDCPRVLAIMNSAGYDAKVVYPHWLAKVIAGAHFIDIIYNAGNGLVPVDDRWFSSATQGELWGTRVSYCSVTDLIWSKAFVMERERFDGADVIHLLRAHAETVDWTGLLDRFGARWRVLFCHLVLFGFVYPSERSRIPAWVIQDLLARVENELLSPTAIDPVCHGTLLSREQYLHDVAQWGYGDARLPPTGAMTKEDIELWTAAIGGE